MLPPRTAEVLAYMMRLAPIGEPFHIGEHQLAEMGFRRRNTLTTHLTRLQETGVLRCTGRSVYVVLTDTIPEYRRYYRRVINKVEKHAESQSAKAFRADALARLAEIPRDTRDLTARVCGDPLKGRSALDRRKSA